MFRKIILVALVTGLLGATGCLVSGGRNASPGGSKKFTRGTNGTTTVQRAAKDTPNPTASRREVPALVTSIRKYETPEPPAKRMPVEKVDLNEPVTLQDSGKVYKLRPSDVVSITLRGIPNPDQVDDIVDENGFVTLPYIDRVQAAGKTSSELERIIRKGYLDGRIYKDVTVNVVVPTQNYFIRGEVKRPSRYPLVAGVTLIQALAAAGGYTEYANTGKIKILRGGESFTVNAKNVEKHPEQDVTIEAGDVIVVPRSVF